MSHQTEERTLKKQTSHPPVADIFVDLQEITSDLPEATLDFPEFTSDLPEPDTSDLPEPDDIVSTTALGKQAPALSRRRRAFARALAIGIAPIEAQAFAGFRPH